MNAAQITFLAIFLGVSPLLTALLYPGVKKHAASRKDSWLAAAMAALLFSAFLALFFAFLVNGVRVAIAP